MPRQRPHLINEIHLVAAARRRAPGGHWALLEQGGTGTLLRLHLGTAGVSARRMLTLAAEPTALALVGDWPSASAVLWLYTSRDSDGRSHLRFAASGNATVPDAVALPAGAGTVRKLSARRALNGDLVVAAAMDGESGDGRSVWLANLSTGLVAVIRANGQVRDIQLSSAVTERLLVLQGDDDETLELDSHDLTGSPLGQAILGKPGSVQRVRLLPSKDATLYEDFSGAVANGSGEGLFVGFTGQGRETRALMRFRLHDAIPPGSSILAGQLTLVQTRSRNPALPLAAFELERHRAEGASNPGGEEGTGTLAQAGDVTWLHANRPVWAWTRAGGDFGAAPLADQIVRTGSNTMTLSVAAVARLQQWLDRPELNRGLLLKCGGEASSCQAIRLGSRNSADASEWPWLDVEFALPAE